MGRYCRICQRVRANEKFSGSSHRQHVCKDCQRTPRKQREKIDRRDELYGYLRQSNISDKNIARLEILSKAGDEEIRLLAALILDIARVKPGKNRRIKVIAQRHWELFVRMVGLLDDAFWDDYWSTGGHGDEWLYDRFEEARREPHRRAFCFCGSGLTYWECCADRDDAAAAQLGVS